MAIRSLGNQPRSPIVHEEPISTSFIPDASSIEDPMERTASRVSRLSFDFFPPSPIDICKHAHDLHFPTPYEDLEAHARCAEATTTDFLKEMVSIKAKRNAANHTVEEEADKYNSAKKSALEILTAMIDYYTPYKSSTSPIPQVSRELEVPTILFELGTLKMLKDSISSDKDLSQLLGRDPHHAKIERDRIKEFMQEHVKANLEQALTWQELLKSGPILCAEKAFSQSLERMLHDSETGKPIVRPVYRVMDSTVSPAREFFIEDFTVKAIATMWFQSSDPQKRPSSQDILKALEDPVTFDTLEEPRILPCGHTFSKATINNLDPKTCPCCRKPFEESVPNTFIQKILQFFEDKKRSEDKFLFEAEKLEAPGITPEKIQEDIDNYRSLLKLTDTLDGALAQYSSLIQSKIALEKLDTDLNMKKEKFLKRSSSLQQAQTQLMEADRWIGNLHRLVHSQDPSAASTDDLKDVDRYYQALASLEASRRLSPSKIQRYVSSSKFIPHPSRSS